MSGGLRAEGSGAEGRRCRRQGGPPQALAVESRGPRGDRPEHAVIGETVATGETTVAVDPLQIARAVPRGLRKSNSRSSSPDSLYLDNQAHAVVSRMRDMDSGTKSQLRRFYNAVRRPDSGRRRPNAGAEFVMLRARLAYTIARHGLRSLDTMEKLLLQVTRRNDARGYERFRDLFEAIVAYNE